MTKHERAPMSSTAAAQVLSDRSNQDRRAIVVDLRMNQGTLGMIANMFRRGGGDRTASRQHKYRGRG